MLFYDEPSDISKVEFSEIVANGTAESKCEAAVRAVHSIADYDWLVAEFKSLLKDPNIEVRGVAATCIGHLARLHDEANKEQLIEILNSVSEDADIQGRVEDAMDDIGIFL